jgi:hypothetical protein
VSDQLNKMKYAQFVKQARGVDVTEITVTKGEKRDKVVLTYVGTARNRQRLHGEWAIPRGERSADDVKADIQKFLAQARKDFFVRRGQGLDQDDAFKDAAQEVEVKTIQNEAEKK